MDVRRIDGLVRLAEDAAADVGNQVDAGRGGQFDPARGFQGATDHGHGFQLADLPPHGKRTLHQAALALYGRHQAVAGMLGVPGQHERVVEALRAARDARGRHGAKDAGRAG